MKNFTRILSVMSLILVMALNARSQDVFKVAHVGIGAVGPAQALDITGNVKFSGAIMPNNAPGAIGNILLSGGAGPAFPTWLANGANGLVLTAGATGIPAYILVGYWKLTGNSGTVAGVNFLGTTDDKQFRFYVTGQGGGYNGPAGSIDPQFIGATAYANTYLGGPNTNNSNSGGAGNNDAGSYNVGIGFGAMGFANTSATYNVAVGSHALEPINAAGAMSGSYNVSVGASSNLNNLSGNYNTALGLAALEAGIYNSTVSNYNTAVGSFALSANNQQAIYFHSYNTAYGYDAQFTPAAGASNSNTLIGTQAGYQSTGSRNTAVGDSALYINSTGTNNTVLGYNATVSSAALTNATAIGYNALAPVSNSVTFGNSSVHSLYIPGYNATGSLYYTSNSNGFVSSLTPGAGSSGYFVQSNGPGVAPAWANVSVTPGTVTNVTGTAPIIVNGSWNIGIQGTSANQGGVLYSTGAGTSALFTSPGIAGQVLTSTGSGAPIWAALPTTSWNVSGGNTISTTYGTNFIGTINNADFSIYQYTSGGNTNVTTVTGLIDPNNQNIYFGGIVNGASPGVIGWPGALTAPTNGASNNVAIGNGAFGNAPNCCNTFTPMPVGASNNVFVGYGSGLAYGSVSSNLGVAGSGATLSNGSTAIGNATIRSASTGAVPNTAFGGAAMTGPGSSAVAGGNYNTALGRSAINSHTTGTKNVAVGESSLATSTSSSANTALGYESLYSTSTGTNNTAAGYLASFATSSGTNNVSVGYQALTAISTSNYNVGFGYNALSSATTTSSNTGVGTYAARLTTAGKNVAIGDSALYNNTTGTDNTSIGHFANVTAAGITNASVIGANATTGLSNSVTLGSTAVVGGTSAAALTSGLYLPGYNSVGSLLYTFAGTGQVSSLPTGTSGYFLQSNGPGVAPTWANVTIGAGTVTSVTGVAPMVIVGTWNINIQGNASGTDQGGVLYSTGTGNSALFTSTGTSGQYLTSNGTSAPTWQTSANALWSLNGNAGTNPAINFIGTTNDLPLVFLTDGGTLGVTTYAGQIDPGNLKGNVYFGMCQGLTAANALGGGGDGGNFNVGLGESALATVTTGNYNVVLSAYNTAMTTTTGSYNIAMGYETFGANVGGNGNIAIGRNVLNGQSGSVSYNTIIGYQAAYGGTDGPYNTAIGSLALSLGSTASFGYSNTALGANSENHTTGKLNTGIGDSTLATNTTGNKNTALGYAANVNSGGYTNATAIGYQALATGNNEIVLGNASVVGGTSIAPLTSGLYIPGYNSVGSFFYTSNANGQVSALNPGPAGYYLQSNGPGAAPAWVSVAAAGGSVTSVTGTAPIIVSPLTANVWTVGIQGAAGNADKGGVLYSAGVGTSALFTPTGTSGNYLQSNGTGVPTFLTPASLYSSAAWSITGNSGTTSANFIGTTDNHRLAISVDGATLSGSLDMPTATNGATGFANVYLGSGSTNSGTIAGNEDQGTYNVALGRGTMASIGTTATGNVAAGTLAANNAYAAGGSYNITFGYTAGINITTGNGNVAMGGSAALHASTTGNYNTALGFQSCQSATTGSFKTGVGFQSLYTETTAASNTGIGNYAGYFISTGSRNTAIGDSTFDASSTNLSTGTNNVALGFAATVGTPTVSGAAFTNSIAIGYKSTTPASNTISLGNTSVAGGTSAAPLTSGIYLPGYNLTGSLFYISANTGQVSALTPGTSGYYLQSNGIGVAPSWANVSASAGTVTSITGTAPITVTQASNIFTVGIQGVAGNKGGVLYSTGGVTSAAFTATPAAASLYLTSAAAGGAPTWSALPITSVWDLTGNSSTTPGTNFLGTSDDQPLRFREDGAYAGSIDPQTVGGVTFGNTYFGNERTTNTENGAGNSDVGTYNCAYGNGTMGQSVAGQNYNIAMGPMTMGEMTVAGPQYNIGAGYATMRGLDVGVGNIGLGTGTYSSGTSSYNIGIGYFAMHAGGAAQNGLITTTYLGNYNSAIGYQALFGTATASVGGFSNTVIGLDAGYYITTGSRNTGIGDSTFIGTGNADATLTTGTNNTVVGYHAAVGTATIVGAAFTNSTAIGYLASGVANNSITLGNSTAISLYIPGYNTPYSLFYTSASNGLVSSITPGTSGYFLQSNGLGAAPSWANIAGSASTLTTVTGVAPMVVSGTWLVGIQGTAANKGGVLYSAGALTTAAFTATPASAGLILTSSAAGAAPTWTSYTTPVASTWQITGNAGTTAGTNFIGTTDATRLGFRADAIAIGTIDLPPSLGGNGNSYYGYESGFDNNSVATTSGTTIYGDEGQYNTAIGNLAYHDPDYTGPGTASYNVAIGASSFNNQGNAGSTGSYNLGVGFNGLYELTTGNGNVALCIKGAHSIEVGNYNTGFGYTSFSNTDNANGLGSFNVVAGYASFLANTASPTTDNSNTVIGAQAYAAGYYPRNAVVGSFALTSQSTGFDNVAVGDSAFNGIAFTSAAPYNTALGTRATATAATLTNVTSIGASADAGTSNSIVLGQISGVNAGAGTVSNTDVGIGTNTFPATEAVLAMETGHIETQAASTVPTVTVNPLILSGGGSGGFITAQGYTDVAGRLTFTTPVSSNFGPNQITVNFAKAYNVAPTVVLAPANSAASGAMTASTYGVYVTSTTTGFTVNFNGSLVGSANQTYNFNYFVIETQ